MIMLIIPFITLFSVVSLNGAIPTEALRGAEAAQTLYALKPLFTHLETVLNLPLSVTVVNETDLDISFATTKTTAVVTIKEDVLCDFIPEIIEVVIAARVARWMSCSQIQKNILGACQKVRYAGATLAALSSILSAYKWLNTRTLSFGEREKYAVAGLATVGGAWLGQLLVEWNIKNAEEHLTKNLIFTPEARLFLSRLSADSRASLASQKNLRFLFEKFREAA